MSDLLNASRVSSASLLPESAPFDMTATISRLFIYPVKSCAGVALEQAVLTETGLQFDRSWMVVDEHGHFLSQRELPRMVLIEPQLTPDALVLHAPGMPALSVALSQTGQSLPVKVWDDALQAHDMGPLAAQWFSDFLGITARLVRFDPAQKRICSLQWTQGAVALNQFSDGYSVLVISEASLAQFNQKLRAQGHAAVGMERFRPNIVFGQTSQASPVPELAPHEEDLLDTLHISTAQGVVELKLVKPCPRCPIPNIEPATALSSPEVGDLLQSYRQDPRVNGAPTFGMNAIVQQGAGHVLRVSQAIGADYRFD